jgi:hypothetical protein
MKQILFLVAICVTAVRPAECDDIHSVCELLQRPELMSGKNIEVTGIYTAGPHGSGISDPACTKPIEAKGQLWTPEIWVSTPGSRSFSRFPDIKDFDIVAYRALIDARNEAARNGNVVRATFAGRLEYCPIYGSFTNSFNDRPRWFGCGYLFNHPLQLLLRTVTDIRFESRKPQSQ